MPRIRRKIKRKVNILGHDYHIKLVGKRNLSGSTVGTTEHPARVIKISKDLGGEELWLIYLHELRHAYHYESGDTQILSNQSQEKDCEQFASFISSLQKQGVL